MMDRPAIHAAEDFLHAGYPLDVEALLIVELDGPGVEVDHLIGLVEAIAHKNGSTTCRISTSEEERLSFWAGRKAAFPAVGRISPDYYCMDGTIPRKELPRCLPACASSRRNTGCRVANVFHAGDGNLHPLILYDANKPGELDKAESFGADILRLCVKVGGVLTGEHGVGVEKRDLMGEMFNQIDLDQQMRVKCAFDPEPSAQPGQSVPAASPLRRARPHACLRRQAAVPEHPEVLNPPHDHLPALHARRRGERRGMGDLRRRAGRDSGTRLEARHRTSLAMRACDRPVGDVGRHALRAGGAGAVGQDRHADRRHRAAARAERPAARLRADGLLAPAGP